MTTVLVEPADPDAWFIAGERPTAFVAAASEGMQDLLGDLHDESCVFLHAVDGDAYGYGGRTQNGRWAAAHPA